MENIVTIKQIKENLDEFLDKSVTIEGKVITWFTLRVDPLLESYMLKDESDFILIFPKGNLPPVGSMKVVEGIVKRIPFNQDIMITIEED